MQRPLTHNSADSARHDINHPHALVAIVSNDQILQAEGDDTR